MALILPRGTQEPDHPLSICPQMAHSPLTATPWPHNRTITDHDDRRRHYTTIASASTPIPHHTNTTNHCNKDSDGLLLEISKSQLRRLNLCAHINAQYHLPSQCHTIILLYAANVLPKSDYAFLDVIAMAHHVASSADCGNCILRHFHFNNHS